MLTLRTLRPSRTSRNPPLEQRRPSWRRMQISMAPRRPPDPPWTRAYVCTPYTQVPPSEQRRVASRRVRAGARACACTQPACVFSVPHAYTNRYESERIHRPTDRKTDWTYPHARRTLIPRYDATRCDAMAIRPSSLDVLNVFLRPKFRFRGGMRGNASGISIEFAITRRACRGSVVVCFGYLHGE